LSYYEKYVVKIIDNDGCTLKFEDVLKKCKKKVNRILLEEIKGTMVDNKKLKKLNGVQVPNENRESLFAQFVEEKWNG
jgi:hypothetical protein